MESLRGYGSDDDCDDNSQPTKKLSSGQVDDNYEQVQMDLSEESDESSNAKQPDNHKHQQSSARTRRSNSRNRDRAESSPDRSSRRRDERSYRRDDKYRSGRDGERSRKDEGRGRSGRDGRRSRDDQDRDSRKTSHRGSSRDRHRSRSRSPRRTDYRGRRSSSRDRGRAGGASKRYERSSTTTNSNSFTKADRLDKLGNSGPSGGQEEDKEAPQKEKDRFYMPGITGRFTEQIQRRKLLWQKKEAKPVGQSFAPVVAPQAGQSGKVWQNTTFAQDTDGKVANKFKRLMGIREATSEAPKPANELVKKQEEMFTSMEAQYEVARTATHTMRGVGLGFGSFQR